MLKLPWPNFRPHYNTFDAFFCAIFGHLKSVCYSITKWHELWKNLDIQLLLHVAYASHIINSLLHMLMHQNIGFYHLPYIDFTCHYSSISDLTHDLTVKHVDQFKLKEYKRALQGAFNSIRPPLLMSNLPLFLAGYLDIGTAVAVVADSDSRANPFQGGGDDTIPIASIWTFEYILEAPAHIIDGTRVLS